MVTNNNTPAYAKPTYHLDKQLHGEGMTEGEFYARRAAQLSQVEKHTGTTLSSAFAEMAEQRAKEQAAEQQPPVSTHLDTLLPPGDPLRKKATWEKFHPGLEWPGDRA